MASLVDVFVQSKTTTVDVPTSTSKDEGVKETPSLFDSLLKDTTKKLEKSQEDVKSAEIKTLKNKVPQTNNLDIEENSNNKNVENKIENNDITKKTTSVEDNISDKNTQKATSLLDRLIIEAKGEIAEDKTTSKNSLDKLSKDSEKNENEIALDNKDTEGKIDTTISEKTTNIIPEENSEENSISSDDKKEVENNIVKQPNLQNEVKEESSSNIINKNDVVNNENIKIEVSKEKNKKDNNLEIEDNKLKDNKQEIKDTKIDNEMKLDDKTLLDSALQESQEVIIPKEGEITENNKVETLVSNNSNNSEVIDNLVAPTTENENLITQSSVEEKIEPKKSLMDYLIEKNSQKSIEENTDTKIVTLSKQEAFISNSKDFVSSIYLGEQKNSMVNQFLFNKNEALKLLQNASVSLEDIENSANILNLGLDDVSMEQENLVQTLKNTKQNVSLSDEKQNILDSMLSEKNIRSADIKNLITQSVEASKALLDNTLNVADDVTVDISPTLLNNIQSRIIGAKQHMSQMMSDVAKQMYENYKPPVTVFKINLNPVELGSIAILMKNDKNNSLSISMNVSNMATLDTLLDNQNILRNSLSKTFNENTQFNLDFSSSNQNNRGNEQQSSNRQNNRKFGDKIDTQSVLKLKEENKDRDDSLDYM